MERCIETRCPTCGELTAVSVDLDEGHGEVAEDCQVCCRPLHVTVEVDRGEIVHVETGSGW
ncbi:MAG: hypothetical protein AMXMBFR64_21030 [Myxococcales bacterium]